MAYPELENLVRIGQLKKEVPSAAELAGLLRSGVARLRDARNASLSLESRFDLAYAAAHAFARAALRRIGYRAERRYQVFQTLAYSLAVEPRIWRILAKAHGLRNQAEYEGFFEADETLIRDLIVAVDEVHRALETAERGAIE